MDNQNYSNIKPVLGALPNDYDLAIVSINSSGTIGLLNKMVLEAYNYSPTTLNSTVFNGGFFLLHEENNKPILFIVTVGEGNAGVSLKKNLTKALERTQDFLKPKNIWVPLMGTGVGGLDFVDSYDTTIGVLKQFKDINFTIAIPNDAKGNEFISSFHVDGLSGKGNIEVDIETGSKVKVDLTSKKTSRQPGYDKLPKFNFHRLVRDVLNQEYNLDLSIDAIVIRNNVKHRIDLSDSNTKSYAQLIEKSNFIGVKSDSAFTAGTSEVGIMTTIYADIENKINFLQSAGTKVQKYFSIFSNTFSQENIDYAHKWFDNKQGLDVTVLSFKEFLELAKNNGIDHNEYLKTTSSNKEEPNPKQEQLVSPEISIDENQQFLVGLEVGEEIKDYDVIFLPKSSHGGVGLNSIATHILNILGIDSSAIEFSKIDLEENKYKWIYRDTDKKRIEICFIVTRDLNKKAFDFKENFELAILNFPGITLSDIDKTLRSKIFIPLLGTGQANMSYSESFGIINECIQVLLEMFRETIIRMNFPREIEREELDKYIDFLIERYHLSKPKNLDQLINSYFEVIKQNLNTSEQDNFQSNGLTLTTPINDGATAPVDLLDFENDIRAFSVTLAQKKLKPPLAVALFGNWGSGKSFFMHHLAKKIDFLSVHQSFKAIEVNQKADDEEDEKPFCEGVVQINFNAWSYLDSNLWAGLVSTIFEKLDEYISGENVKEKEKAKAQKVVAGKLEIASHEKIILAKEKGILIQEKDSYKAEILRIEGQKDDIYKRVVEKSISDLKQEAKKGLTELEYSVKRELGNFGISEQEIYKLDPNALLEEARSWLMFFKNVKRFSTKQKIAFFLIAIAVLFYGLDPGDILKDIKADLNNGIVYFIGIIAPVIYKFIDTISKYKKFLAPIIKYKNQFNEKFEEVKMDYETSRITLNSIIAEREAEIQENEKKLEEVEVQISDYEFALEHSITKRAFNNFISRKAKDENYEKHLGLISIIRKDFEALSGLFEEVIIPPQLTDKEQKQWKKRKEENEDFRKLFNKPLDRIILYIDDLDRCSDEKVLEVLQAVHLLMAFPLFIVVVGVDKRCVSNALRYRDMLQYGKKVHINDLSDLKDKFGIELIEPREYLEKIFQIPFNLKNAEPDSIKNLIQDILISDIRIEEKLEESERHDDAIIEESYSKEKVTEPDEFEGAKSKFTVHDEIPQEKELIHVSHDDLKISHTELYYLKEISILVGNTPRTIKRFINIYRIIRTHEQLQYRSGNQDIDFLIVMFILAISIGNYKHSIHQLTHLCMRLQKRGLKALLNEKTDENKKDFSKETLDEFKSITANLNSNETLQLLLKIKGEEFMRYTKFVSRFSFGEDLSIKTTKHQPTK